MVDSTSKKPLHVSTDGGVGPYIRVPLSQLEEIEFVLKSRGVRYWVEENAFSFDGSPFTVVINFGRSGDAAAVQAILDSAS